MHAAAHKEPHRSPAGPQRIRTLPVAQQTLQPRLMPPPARLLGVLRGCGPAAAVARWAVAGGWVGPCRLLGIRSNRRAVACGRGTGRVPVWLRAAASSAAAPSWRALERRLPAARVGAAASCSSAGCQLELGPNATQRQLERSAAVRKRAVGFAGARLLPHVAQGALGDEVRQQLACAMRIGAAAAAAPSKLLPNRAQGSEGRGHQIAIPAPAAQARRGSSC